MTEQEACYYVLNGGHICNPINAPIICDYSVENERRVLGSVPDDWNAYKMLVRFWFSYRR
jgi:hypothetical protein